MRKRVLLAELLMLAICLGAACGETGPDYTAYVPSHGIDEIVVKEEEETVFAYRGEVDASLLTSKEKIADKMLAGDKSVYNDIYQNQIIKGACSDLSEIIAGKRTILYVSSSTGSDGNNGLTPETPKKTLQGLSGFEDVAILLRAGDVFNIDGLFYVGTQSVLGSYGEGPRPILDFTKAIEEPFIKVRGYENVWAIDLTRTEFNTETSKVDNCNFGQLYINGECNWKRLVVDEKDCSSYNFAEYIENAPEPCWAVDWVHSVLYLYSSEDPSGSEMRVSSDKNGLDIKDAQNVCVSDIEVCGVGFHGCKISNCENVSITNCYFHNIGGSAMSGSRMGNGISLMSNCKNINVINNCFDDIFETCFATQGLSVTEHLNDITVDGNVFAHATCGVLQVTDEGCLVASTGLKYSNNIFFEMQDLTNPDTAMYANVSGELVDKKIEYVTYRREPSYQMISAMSVNNVQAPGELKLINNLIWDTNRLLTRFNLDYGYPEMIGNCMYGVIRGDKTCLFMNYYSNGTVNYLTKLNLEENTELITVLPALKANQIDEEATVSQEAYDALLDAVERLYIVE